MRISLLTVGLVSLHNAATGYALLDSPSLPLPLRGFSIPLVKRVETKDVTRVANLEILQKHIAQIDAKYRQGILNWQANTGRTDIFPVYPPYNIDVDRNGVSDAAPSSGEALDDPKTVNSRADTASAGPVFSQKHFSQKNPVNMHGLRQKRQSRAHRARKRQAEPLQDIQNDLLWAGVINIGSDAQSFLIDFDTGSADLWIPNVDCDSDQCTNHKLYDSKTSVTSKAMTSQQFKITYGDGSSSSGPVYTDAVSVGGMKADGQYFSAVTTVSDSFGNDPEDGILGLAYSSISELNKPPFFQTLMDQKKVDKGMFSFRLAKTGSELFLGGTNPAKYVGPIEWHPVVSQSYWLIAGAPLVNGKAITANVTKTYNLAIDSGTTVIVAPTADAKAFWQKVPGSAPFANSPGYYTFPCKTPPSVSFTFAGPGQNKAWSISATDFNLGTASAGSPNCVGAVIGQDGLHAWIMGDAFMKNVYSVFDMEQHRIGFAIPK